MYKHILLPTDGSKLSGKGAAAGVRLAKALGAKVTGVYVVDANGTPRLRQVRLGTASDESSV